MASGFKNDWSRTVTIIRHWYAIWVTSGTCHSINRYTKANNKYMKKYDKNEESPYLKYWDVNK